MAHLPWRGSPRRRTPPSSTIGRYCARRLARVVPLLLLVTFVALVLVALVPGDPAVRVGGEFATPAQLDLIRRDLDLDRPLPQRYVEYVAHLARGDFGSSVSFQPGRSVFDILAEVAPATLSLAGLTLVLTVLLGVPGGVLAALGRGSVVDRALSALMSMALAVPPFVLGPLLVTVLAIDHDYFPAVGYSPLFDGPGQWFLHLALPAVALGLNPAAEVARQVRASLVGELDESYVRTANAKGLATIRVVGKHALKNAAIPAVTVLGLQVGRIVGGSVVVEGVFGLPGLGSLAYRAVTRSDFPILQALIVLTALAVLLTNLLVDLSYFYFDPRLRDRAGAGR